uniref:Uncharacterized protein n=1 Tax=Rhizophora mucronata TaxID=61149 RepID=A0A2P2P6F4_RHIMU
MGGKNCPTYPISIPISHTKANQQPNYFLYIFTTIGYCIPIEIGQ